MSYDKFREGVTTSMSLPWTPRPLYKTKAQDTTPRGTKLDRRTRRLRRLMWHVKDDLGLLLIIVAVFVAGVLMWGTVAGIEKWIK